MTTNRFLTIVNGVRTLVTGISTSAGAGDANKLIATNSAGLLDSTLLPAGIGADAQAIVTSEALAAGDFVNILNNAGTPNARKADSSNARAAHGFTLAAVASGQTATIFRAGRNSSLTGLTAGLMYYLGVGGAATVTAPTTVGQIIQELGVAGNATSISFDFDSPTTIQ